MLNFRDEDERDTCRNGSKKDHTKARCEKGGNLLKIKELRDGTKRVDIEAKVTEKTGPREVMSRYKDVMLKVANATISDDTGSIKLTLWNDQIEQVNVNDTIKIEGGYVTSFRGEIQLNIGRYGKLSVVQ
jgi:replication factor A1